MWPVSTGSALVQCNPDCRVWERVGDAVALDFQQVKALTGFLRYHAWEVGTQYDDGLPWVELHVACREVNADAGSVLKTILEDDHFNVFWTNDEVHIRAVPQRKQLEYGLRSVPERRRERDLTDSQKDTG